MNLAGLVAKAPFLVLEAPRLALRRFTPADIPFAVAQEQDRTVMQWIRDPQPIEAMQARAEAMAAPWRGNDGEWLAFTVVPPGFGRAVGIVVCRVTNAAHETMEIGYKLEPGVHRRGQAAPVVAGASA